METTAETDATVRGGPEARLSERVIALWRLPYLVLAGLTGIAVALTVALQGSVAVIVILGLLFVGIVVAAAIVPRVRYRSWAYRAGPDQLDLRSGIVVRRESSIPYFRVQHIDVRQGPFERWRGIVSLDIATASSSSGSTLPGVDPADADRLRAYVLARAGLEDGV